MSSTETIKIEYKGKNINVKIAVDKDGNYDETKAKNIAKQLYIISEVGL